MIDKMFSPKGYSQPFVWFAKYNNNEMLTEFEDSGKENEFKDIDKSRLAEFGMLGRGAKLSYSVATGVFDITGKKVEFMLECEDGSAICLNGSPRQYNDVITFKSAYLDYDPATQQSENIIDGYFFGYKHSFAVNGMSIHSKIVFALPMEDTMRFGVRLVTDKSIIGKLIVFVDGAAVKELDVNLTGDEAQELEWLFIC